MKVRTRFAPSPTGRLHIGGVRTALYCYALAKKHVGEYVLRIEDTDRTRFSAEGLEEIYTALKMYSLEPTESDRHGGEFGPYTQSNRLDLYKKFAEELVNKGGAYYCFLSKEEEDQLRKDKPQNYIFRSPYRDMELAETKQLLSSGKPYTIRQKFPLNQEVRFVDGLQGEQRVNTNDMDDKVLLKSDGFPTYHLAMLVDDHLMEITHVFRAVEWLPSAPAHVLLYQTMGWEMPLIYHVTAILDPEGGKLSKRRGHTAAMDFIKAGYLPEAVLNFLMFLGWSSPEDRKFGEAEREIYSLAEFTELFDVKDLNRSNPVFNRDKLLWFNKEYLSKVLDASVVTAKYLDWMETEAEDKTLLTAIKADSQLQQKVDLVRGRAELLQDISDQLAFFYTAPQNVDWDIKQLAAVNDQIPIIKRQIAEFLDSLSEETAAWTHEQWESGMRAIGDKLGIKHGEVFMVLRVAVVGGPFSPPLFESLQLLPKTEILQRLN